MSQAASAPGFDALIVGGGPAGLTCARELSAHGLKVALIDREGLGGRLVNADSVFDVAEWEGISGAEAGGGLAELALDAGVVIEFGEVERLRHYDGRWIASFGGAEVSAPIAVLATGSRSTKIDVSGAAEFEGKGVSYCAACDGPLYKGKDVVVLIGDEWGADEVVQLARSAKSVTALVTPDCDPRLQVRLPRLSGLDHVRVEDGVRAVQISGSDIVAQVVLDSGGDVKSIPTQGVFGSLGTTPNTELVRDQVELGDDGAARIDDSFATSVHGLFAIGEARSGSAHTAPDAMSDARQLAARLARDQAVLS